MSVFFCLKVTNHLIVFPLKCKLISKLCKLLQLNTSDFSKDKITHRTDFETN